MLCIIALTAGYVYIYRELTYIFYAYIYQATVTKQHSKHNIAKMFSESETLLFLRASTLCAWFALSAYSCGRRIACTCDLL